VLADDDDDDELQSEIEAQHASTRIQHKASHAAHPEMVTSRQRKGSRINNPHSERTDNRIFTEHKL
jgi:hypothetical protein